MTSVPNKSWRAGSVHCELSAAEVLTPPLPTPPHAATQVHSAAKQAETKLAEATTAGAARLEAANRRAAESEERAEAIVEAMRLKLKEEKEVCMDANVHVRSLFFPRCGFVVPSGMLLLGQFLRARGGRAWIARRCAPCVRPQALIPPAGLQG